MNEHYPTSQEAAPDISPELRRAYAVEQALDPDHTLPDVAVLPDPGARTPSGNFVPQPHLITHEGTVIGNCVVVTNKKAKERWFNGIEVSENYRGEGFGLAAYKEIIEQAMTDGYDFTTHDWSQTEGAKKMWELLHEKGLAEEISAFTSDGNGRYVGEYRIAPGPSNIS